MRVLHLISSVDPVYGGPSNVLARLAPEQVRSGHEVCVATVDTPDRLVDVKPVLEPAGVRMVHPSESVAGPFASDKTGGLFASGAARAMIDEATDGWAPDVAHIHGLWHSFPHAASAELRERGIPYAVRPCGMLDPAVIRMSGAWKKKLFLALRGRRDINGARAMHFTTATERDLVGPMGLTPEPFVIPNGIAWSEYEALPERGSYRAESGIGDAPMAVFFSRLHGKKGLDILLPAFARGAPADAHLVLVGPGDDGYVAGLRRDAERLGIAGRTRFTGMLKGAARFAPVVDADLFVLPSYQENFGVAVVEALACGTPALISDQVNIFRDVVDAGVGRAEPCDVDATAKAIGGMLADRGALREMGARGREWARETYAWTSIVAKIDAMYGFVAGG
ncbi:MAG: glycosyltransferase [Planctomycetota bacterium]